MAGNFQRATLFMDKGKFGWSETYVHAGTSPGDIFNEATVLMEKRRLILGSNCNLNIARLSDAEVFRDSRIIQMPPGSSGQKATEKCTEPWTCVLARLEAGTEYRRNIFLRGVPDAYVNPSFDLDALEPSYQDDVKAFLKYLVKEHWGFLVRDKLPLNQLFNVAVGRVIYTDNITIAGKQLVRTNQPHQLLDGDRVIIRGVKGARSVNGVHEVKVTGVGTPSEFLLIGVNDDRFYLGGGQWRLYKNKLVTPDRATFVRVAKRDTGRPFDSPRGRRLTRKP